MRTSILRGAFRATRTANYVKPSGGSAPAPTVTSASLASVPWRPTAITLTGTNFVSGATVGISVNSGSTWTPCTSVTFGSSTSITATTPAQSANAASSIVRFRVTNPDTQTGTLGSGNVAVQCDPKDFTGLVAEYRGDVGNTVSGGLISKVADQSGVGNDVTATGGQQPTQIVAGLNGRNTISFDGVANFLRCSSFALGGSTFCMFAVMKQKSTAGPTCAVDYNNLNPSLVYAFTGAGLSTEFMNSAQNLSSTANTTNQWHRFTMRVSASAEDLLVDGADHQTSTFASSAPATSGVLTIGARQLGDLFEQMELAHLLIYNVNQIPNEAAIDSYLLSIWGSGSTVEDSIDMSSFATSYAGLTYARTGADAVAAASASTTRTIAAGLPLYEDRGDGVSVGVWTHPALTNDAPQDLTTWTTVHSAAVTAQSGQAPDGTSTAYEVNDTDAANVAGAKCTFTAGARVMSCWVRDHAGAAPTVPGMIGSDIATPGSGFGVSCTSGTTWRRVSYKDDSSLSGAAALNVLPAGAQPGSSSASATGALDVYAPSSISLPFSFQNFGSSADPPCFKGSTSAGTGQIANFSKIVRNGEIAIRFRVTAGFSCRDQQGSFSDRYLFGAHSANGATGIRYSQSGGNRIIASVEGTDILTLGTGNGPPVGFNTGDELDVVFWYRASQNECGLRVGVNGMYVEIRGTAALTLATMTVGYLGSDYTGANNFFGQFYNYQSRSGSQLAGGQTDLFPLSPEIFQIGDSIATAFSFGDAFATVYYARNATRRTLPGILNQAISGKTLVNQKATLDASPYKGMGSVKAVIIEAGINDLIIDVVNEATFVSRYQALVNDIRAAWPTAKIYGQEMTPCKAYLNANGLSAQYAVWLACNADIGGTGTNPITGLDRVISSQVAALNDGSGNLLSQYDSGDGLHPIEPGRFVIGNAVRTGLLADGIVT